MVRTRDKIIFGYILFMWLYVCYNLFHDHSYELTDNLSDTIFLSICLVWGFICLRSKRYFTFTPSKVRKFDDGEKLEYIPTVSDDKIKRLLVKPINGNIWYDIDYEITIGKDASFRTYQDFYVNNKTCGELYNTMIKKLRDKFTNDIYSYDRTLSKQINWCFGIVLVIFLSILWFSYSNDSTLINNNNINNYDINTFYRGY